MFKIISLIFIVIGILSTLIILVDILKHPQKDMPVMNLVWPLNGLWAGPFGIWTYFTIGKYRKMDMSNMKVIEMPKINTMDMTTNSKVKYSSFWQGVIVDTLHCGAGCSLADLIGSWIFLAFPFEVFNNLTFGEWTLEYFLALLTGVTFQYAAIAPMMKERGPKVWLKALKIDFLSLTSWQIGMYGWMALVTFVLFGSLSPTTPEFWFMMQIAMFCGFITAYPVNWWLVKTGMKIGM